jgi:DNA-binding response OmpR family regulator
VIFLTCRDENDSVVKACFKAPMLCDQPYDLSVLSARVAAQLRRSGISSAGRIELAPLSIDFLLGEATLCGEKISLTQKECNY